MEAALEDHEVAAERAAAEAAASAEATAAILDNAANDEMVFYNRNRNNVYALSALTAARAALRAHINAHRLRIPQDTMNRALNITRIALNIPALHVHSMRRTAKNQMLQRVDLAITLLNNNTLQGNYLNTIIRDLLQPAYPVLNIISENVNMNPPFAIAYN